MAKIAFFLCGILFVHGSSPESCFEGGVPAIFQSPECTEWVRLANSLKNNSGKSCDMATLQGHRDYQEDRMTCNLDINIPLLGKEGVKEAKLDVLAIFDGHGGAQASEMANQKFLDYFLLHVVLQAFKGDIFNVDQHYLIPASPPKMLSVTDESLHDILKEALLRSIHDIEMEFTSEAFKKQSYAGSTATVVLLLNGEEMLVASLGDSPALLCKGGSMRKLRAEKLTRDHHPDEEDERARIESVGGFVRIWGVPRVNGVLAVSRAIEDISLKRFGVSAEPEVKDWRKLTKKDRYLIIASDGLFEGLKPNDVCNLIQAGGSTTSSLSDSIVKKALKKGSTDNLSAIVLPLKQPALSQSSSKQDL